MKSTVCKLQDNLKHRMVTTVVSCFSSPLPVREPLYDGPFCTETEFFDLLRMASTPRKAVSLSTHTYTSEAWHLHGMTEAKSVDVLASLLFTH